MNSVFITCDQVSPLNHSAGESLMYPGVKHGIGCQVNKYSGLDFFHIQCYGRSSLKW